MTSPTRWLAAAFALPVLACAAPVSRTQTLFAGHRATMTALGFRAVGQPAEGQLARGQTRRHPVHLEAGECYRVVALGDAETMDLELALVAPTGQRSAASETSGNEASVRFCPSSAGDFGIALSARAGAGHYVVAVWEDHAPAEPATAQERNGTCEAPYVLEFGQTVEGSTANARDNTSGTCLRGRGPDVIYALQVPTRRRVVLTVRTDFDAALYLQHDCGSVSAEVSCCNLAVVRGVSRIDTVLDPGTYFVVVDSTDNGRRGRFTLAAEMGEAPELAQLCAQLPAITPGSPVHGDTSGRPDLMRGSCAEGHFPGPEQAYSLALVEPSRVRVALTADGEWDTGLYIRRACAQEDTEVACNDDAEDQQHARIARTLEAGQYTLVVDGYVAGSQGPYTLAVETAPLAGSGIPNDACATAQPIALDSTTPGDTFAARDDTAGSCGGDGAPDAVYRLAVARRTHLRAELARSGLGDVPGSARLYLTRACGNPRAELACGRTTVDAVVGPGTYYLVVDGATREDFGQFVLRTAADDPAGIDAACRNVPALVPGRPVQGTTSGTDRLHASCGNRARSPEQVYSIHLTERRHLVVDVHAQFDSVLSLRAACDRESSELACNDDYQGQRASRIEADLDAGTYYVVVDGFDQGNAGAFTIEATVTAPGTAPVPGPAGSTLPLPGAPRPAPAAPAPRLPPPPATGNPCG